MKLMTLLALIFSAHVFGQVSDRFELENRVLRRVQMLERAVRNNLDLISTQDLQRILSNTNRSISLARGNGNGPGEAFIISAQLEATSFVVEAFSISDLHNKCEEKVSTLATGSVDDIYVSFNSAARLHRHTSGWWTQTKTKCDVIVALAIEGAYKQGIHMSSYRYLLYGQADALNIFAEGDTLEDLEFSCKQNLGSTSFSVDDIRVSLNGGQVRTQHTSGWWTSAAQICNTAISLVF